MRPLSEIRNYMDSYHVKSGVYHYYRNEFSQALGFLRKGLADESVLSPGDLASARRYLTLSLKGLGKKLAADGEVEQGAEQLRLAAEVSPSYADVHFELACLLERLGRVDDAVASYRRAIECQPDYLEAHVTLANCLLDAGRTDEATEVLRRAVELRVEAVRRPFERGVDVLGQGDERAAREWFHEALCAVPQLSAAYIAEAVEWIRVEEYGKAVESIDRALEYGPKYPDLHNYRGIALCGLERYDDALAAFRRSAELCPDHLVPRLNLAFTLLRAERHEEGEAELTAILARHPEEPVARARLEELRSARVGERRGSGGRS